MKAGDTLGKYQILSRLARGGMAEVWLARFKGVGGFEKDVVLKTILPNLSEDPDFIRMFIDEALLAAKLNHPNIVQIFDLGCLEGMYFIAMEYVPGKSLRQVARKLRADSELIPTWFVLRVVVAVCDGLQYAHDYHDSDGRPLNLVHRDISPENIMVSFTGTVKLLDFGIAKATTAASVTRAGMLKGKYSYISPEQVRGFPATARSDIYAVGVVLYELLTGTRPYSANSDLELLRQVVQGKPPAVAEIAPWVPPDLQRIIYHALANNPEERYQDATDLGSDLLSYLQSIRSVQRQRDLALYIGSIFRDEPNIPIDLLRSLASASGVSVVSSVGGAEASMRTETPAPQLVDGISAIPVDSGVILAEIPERGHDAAAPPPPPGDDREKTTRFDSQAAASAALENVRSTGENPRMAPPAAPPPVPPATKPPIKVPLAKLPSAKSAPAAPGTPKPRAASTPSAEHKPRASAEPKPRAAAAPAAEPRPSPPASRPAGAVGKPPEKGKARPVQVARPKTTRVRASAGVPVGLLPGPDTPTLASESTLPPLVEATPPVRPAPEPKPVQPALAPKPERQPEPAAAAQAKPAPAVPPPKQPIKLPRVSAVIARPTTRPRATDAAPTPTSPAAAQETPPAEPLGAKVAEPPLAEPPSLKLPVKKISTPVLARPKTLKTSSSARSEELPVLRAEPPQALAAGPPPGLPGGADAKAAVEAKPLTSAPALAAPDLRAQSGALAEEKSAGNDGEGLKRSDTEPDSAPGTPTRPGPGSDAWQPSGAGNFFSVKRPRAREDDSDVFTSFRMARDRQQTPTAPEDEAALRKLREVNQNVRGWLDSGRRSWSAFESADRRAGDGAAVVSEPRVEPEQRDFGLKASRTRPGIGAEVAATRHFEKGLLALREGRYPDALAAWNEAIELDPENTLYQSNLRRLKKLMDS